MVSKMTPSSSIPRITKWEYLEATWIGKNPFLPVHEVMQFSCLIYNIRSRTQP